MSKILAIGGGEIGRPGTKMETIPIDKEIIKLSNKKNPKILFIPTASSDSSSYYKVIKKYFGKKLGCKTSVLYLINKKYKKEELRKIILSTDIIYVGGGDTLKMIEVWKENKLDLILKEALDKGIVLSGISAGAICWFKYGCSDSLKFSNNKNSPLMIIKGLNFTNGLFCPHYDFEKDRKPELKRLLKGKKYKALALDNCTAIEIIDDKYRILNSKKTAGAYILYWNKDKYIKKTLEKNKWFNLKELFK